MPGLVRVSFSIEEPLYRRLEKLLGDSGYTNRSEFIRDMVRGRLVEKEWDKNAQALGTITLVYDHHSRTLSKRLTALQHKHHHAVLATTHVHMDARLCAEMIMMKGRARDIERLSNELRQEKGVLHANLSMSSTGARLA